MPAHINELYKLLNHGAYLCFAFFVFKFTGLHLFLLRRQAFGICLLHALNVNFFRIYLYFFRLTHKKYGAINRLLCSGIDVIYDTLAPPGNAMWLQLYSREGRHIHFGQLIPKQSRDPQNYRRDTSIFKHLLASGSTVSDCVCW